MRSFLDENFLLQTDTAVELYHSYAEPMPIFDYHCHLPPDQIAGNKQFTSVTEMWLGGDHYKWRALRANGVPEKYITGDADDWEKFKAWAETVPYTVGNPLYQWTHLELRRYFGVNDLLNAETARAIFDTCNEKVCSEDFRTQNVIQNMNVKVICTTDDPADSLEYHAALQDNGDFPVKVLPAFRPDKIFQVKFPEKLNPWIDSLAAAAGTDIKDYSSLIEALGNRVDFFHSMGCRTSDHGIDFPFSAKYSSGVINEIFLKVRAASPVDDEEAEKLCTAIFIELGKMYSEKEWTMQIHLGALRNINSRMARTLGADTGFDSIGDFGMAVPLAWFLDKLDSTNQLPRTILYSLNGKDNEVLATVAGSFQDGSIAGKMQLGSGWWFNDQRDGMEKQMTALANLGLLRRFVGMITDSRSFLSYPRHEYFRRVLCNLIGNWVENGEIPHDMALLGPMVQDISFNNAPRYFGIQ